MQLSFISASDPLDPFDDVADSLDRLSLAGQRMANDALRAGGVYVGRPDDSETLAAVSVGAEPTAAERSESRTFTRRCQGCWMPRYECQCAPSRDAREANQ